jgi:hypothetical protein
MSRFVLQNNFIKVYVYIYIYHFLINIFINKKSKLCFGDRVVILKVSFLWDRAAEGA